MDRREALSMMGIMFGGTIIGAPAFLSGCTQSRAKPVLSESDIVFLNEVGETILPATSSSGGAKAAKVGEFMNTIVTDFYTDEEAIIFADGISTINEKSNNKYGDTFVKLDDKKKHELLLELEKEVQLSDDTASHYYIMMKQLSIWGYFTSEIAAREAFYFDPTPNGYDACIPYKKGDKVMFSPVGSGGALNYALMSSNQDKTA
ncbi:MAG: gluconate 2-dehydrogenase subunit 3 family protein [Balneolales bacterium]